MSKITSDSVLVKQSLAPQAVTIGATVNGTGIDCAGYETLIVAVEAGAIADTTNFSVTVKLQESSDDANADPYADITSATTGAIAHAGADETYMFDVDLSERERYIRAVATGGAAGGGLVSATFILSGGRHQPPTQVNTVVSV
jgi:hypothetical protein